MIWLTSETFEHKGVHRVLHRLGEFEADNVYVTAHNGMYYLWESCGLDYWWSMWNKDYEEVHKAFSEIACEELVHIEYTDSEFQATLNHENHIDLGSEIEITPRMVEIGEYVDVWYVDLSIPAGWESCRFFVVGKDRIEWVRKHARLDEPFIIALRKSNFQEVII